MNNLIGRQIGPWTIAEVKKTGRGRNVYVCRHDDGSTKGFKGYQINQLLKEVAK